MSVGVAAEIEVLAPLGLSVGGLEVTGKLEDCVQDLAGEFAEGKEGTGAGSTLDPMSCSPVSRSPAPRHPASSARQTLGPASPGVCPGSPAHIDVGRGPSGAPDIGWEVDCLGRLLLHSGWVWELWSKLACVEFLFDPHGGINRKRRAPSPGRALVFVVGSGCTAVRRLPRDPCRMGRPGWGWVCAL